jgi:thiol-disulfide isomerase/thioredoxin
VVGAVSLAFFNHPSSAGYRTTTEGWVLPRLGAPGKVSLAAFKGRPVIVNFFASWCTVCASELPVFTKEIV